MADKYGPEKHLDELGISPEFLLDEARAVPIVPVDFCKSVSR